MTYFIAGFSFLVSRTLLGIQFGELLIMFIFGDVSAGSHYEI